MRGVRQRILLAEAYAAQAAGDRDQASTRLRAALALAPDDGGALLDLAAFAGRPGVAATRRIARARADAHLSTPRRA